MSDIRTVSVDDTRPVPVTASPSTAPKATSPARPPASAAPPAKPPAAAARPAAGPRTPAEIEADIERTRARLAATIGQVTDRVSPKNVIARLKERARLQVVDEQGNPRVQRLAIAGGAVAALVALRVWRARR